MVEKIIEGLLPGTRSLRPPLIGGLLWCLLFWLMFTDYIPLAPESSGWAEQAYILIGGLGPITGVAVASILVFIVGATLGNISEGVSKVIGTIATQAQSAVQWNRHAKLTEKRLEASIAKLQEDISTISAQIERVSGDEKEVNGRMRIRRERQITQEREKLEKIKEAKLLKFFIRSTPEARIAIGLPPATANAGLESELAESARRDGQEVAMAEQQRAFPSSAFFGEIDARPLNTSDELIAELETDPLEVLRSLDEALFLELDRLRAEREVRLSFATPLLAFSILGAVRLSNPWVLLTALLPLVIMLRHSAEATQERTRVLRLMRLHQLRTPSLARAFEQGKRDVITKINALEETKRHGGRGRAAGLGSMLDEPSLEEDQPEIAPRGYTYNGPPGGS